MLRTITLAAIVGASAGTVVAIGTRRAPVAAVWRAGYAAGNLRFDFRSYGPTSDR